MNNFVLDNSKKQVMRVLNDTFYYLYYDEEPLDDTSLEEIEKIKNKFPYGFYIEDNWKAIENTNQIEIVITPYIQEAIDYDEYYEVTNSKQLQIKWLDDSNIRAWLFNIETAERKLYGDFIVYVNEYGNKCFHIGKQDEEFVSGKMSLYFLKHFKKV